MDRPRESIVVHPRRKAGEAQRDRKHVRLSADLIESLFDRPLPEAAQIVGLGETAFKQACRKLGVLRWPYSSRDQQEPGSTLQRAEVAPQEALPSSSESTTTETGQSIEVEEDLFAFFIDQFGGDDSALHDPQW
eukprot:CAMPEP_0196735546 /NCGR_PEP_ID=MMETSP1091-20130531/13952_1 /TAXON_ID=302021 /ORGANISM="Rhodomonas sp., Strain CCMP768" /LENGTH=133 /DNA_ID=CAMNT_0042079197 /DNA_START=20 /DNA_END=418 /DNA_ORIENTATION=-